MRKPIILLALYLGLLLPASPAGREITVTVGVFQDPRLAALSDSDLQTIFDETGRMLGQKLGQIQIHFQIVKKGDLADLFRPWLQDQAEFQNWARANPPLFSRPQWQKQVLARQKSTAAFLEKNWTLASMGSYYQAKNYADFSRHLLQTYVQKLELLQTYRLKNGQPLFDPAAPLQHSYRAWVKLMELQDDYDLILTNTILVYDDLEKPYPHVVFKHAKVSGSSFESPRRQGALAGATAFATVFELYSREDYFAGKNLPGPELDQNFINRAMGGYLLAHELGHQIFWIPDVYDHPAGCLMDTKFENLQIAEGYRQLLQKPQACPLCRPYVEARWLLFEGQQQNGQGQKKAGQAKIRAGLKALPAKLDRESTQIEQFYRPYLEND